MPGGVVRITKLRQREVVEREVRKNGGPSRRQFGGKSLGTQAFWSGNEKGISTDLMGVEIEFGFRVGWKHIKKEGILKNWDF